MKLTTPLSLLTLLLSLVAPPAVQSTCFSLPNEELPDCVCNETCATCGFAAYLGEETITSDTWCLTCNGNLTYSPIYFFSDFQVSAGACVGPNVCTFDRLFAQECELAEYCKTWEWMLSPGDTFECFGDPMTSMYGEFTWAEMCYESAEAEDGDLTMRLLILVKLEAVVTQLKGIISKEIRPPFTIGLKYSLVLQSVKESLFRPIAYLNVMIPKSISEIQDTALRIAMRSTLR